MSFHQVVGRKTPRRFWIGLFIVICTNVGLSIVSVSIWPYLAMNKLDIYTLAVSIATFHTGGMIGRKLFNKLAERSDHYWWHLIVSISITLIGDILYATYPEQFAILIARFIVGFGTGSQVILQSLLAKTSDTTLQKSRNNIISIVTSCSYVIGPALIAIISNFSIEAKLNVFDRGTQSFYGWLAVIFSFISLVTAIVGKVITHAADRPKEFGINDDIDIAPPRGNLTLFFVCIVHFLIFNAGMILETVFIPFIIDVGGYSSYNWSLTKISLFFMGLGVSCALSSFLAKKVSNNHLLLYGSVISMLVGYAFMMEWTFSKSLTSPTIVDLSPPIFRFLLGVIFVAIGFPIAVTSSITIFFELISTVYTTYASTVFQISSNFGRLLGPIWAALIFDHVGYNYTFLFGLVLSAVAFLIFVSLSRSLKHINTVSVIQKNVPILTMDDEEDENVFNR
eukprot:gene13889-16384_t